MCTLACWVSVFEGAPLVVAANRDERLDRAATGPAKRDGLIAPRDEVAGGTWWALHPSGLFVGLTNRFLEKTDPNRRSRGLLVEDVAHTGSVDAAEAFLRALKPADYNGFHLLATDGRQVVRAVGDAQTIDVVRLGPGLHLVTERSFGAAPTTREAFAHRLLDPLSSRPLEPSALEKAMSEHDDAAPLEGTCVHMPGMKYGTRSSSILVLGDERVLRHASGPPCHTPFEDLSALLA